MITYNRLNAGTVDIPGIVCDFRLGYGKVLSRKSKVIAINRSHDQLYKVCWLNSLHNGLNHFNPIVTSRLNSFHSWLTLNRGVHKTKIWFGFGCKTSKPNPNHPNIWHPCRWFFDRNCMQSAVQIKSHKITLLAFIVHIKNVLKHDRNRVQHVDFRTQLHYLLLSLLCMMPKFINYSIRVWCTQFIQHSTVTLWYLL